MGLVKTGLVLGAGGLVGMTYHAGVLRALEQEAGWDARRADLIVGTSAGSVVGAYLRTGWTTEDFWLLALGEHPRLGAFDEPEARAGIMRRSWRTPLGLYRRALGSAYVVGRSLVRLPLPAHPTLSRMFPGGMFTMAEGRRRFEEELPEEWPEQDLYLCAVDISSGRRIVLGKPGQPPATLRQAVLASTAIPGVYKPVRLGKRVLVDGGAHSTSNLDVAVHARCDLIIGVVPMAWDTGSSPDVVSQLVRRIPAQMLAGEQALAKRRGTEVLLLRPSAAEVSIHGFNMMRPDGLDRIARSAYDATCRALTTDRFARILADLPAA